MKTIERLIKKGEMYKAFYSKVKEVNGCWEWQGAVSGPGYGQTRFFGKSFAAHRVSYEIAYGAIKKGLFVCHKCDNRKCVNPNHFFLGTAKDNTLDMLSKGRHYSAGKPKYGPWPLPAPTRRIPGHCVNGHPQTEETSHIDSRGFGVCKICSVNKTRKYRHKQRVLKAQKHPEKSVTRENYDVTHSGTWDVTQA